MDIILQFDAVFTLLLYNHVFYSCRSIVEIHHFVYRYFYRYFARNSVFFIGILSLFQGKFGLGNIFETPLAALNTFYLMVKELKNAKKHQVQKVKFWSGPTESYSKIKCTPQKK